MDIHNYMIIKMSKLKVSFDISQGNLMNEISGKNWLRKNRSFYPKIGSPS
jgi:hypothetical protein